MELFKEIEGNINLIKREISEFTGISIEEINGNSRKMDIVSARHAVVYFAHKFYRDKVSLAFIGDKSVNKDHSMVIHIINKVNNLIETEMSTKEDFIQMEKLLTVKLHQHPIGGKKDIKHLSSNAQLILTYFEDGEIVQNRIFYDGSVKRLSTFRDKIPVRTIDGDDALFEFKQLVNQITI